MRRYILHTAVIAVYSCGLQAQGLVPDVKAQSVQPAVQTPDTTSNEADCLSLLDAARSHQTIGSNAGTDKRWATSLDAYAKADQEARQALAICVGENQAKAQAFIQRLSEQVAQATGNRQRAEVCRPSFDKAYALDLQAATAKNNKVAINDVERLYARAESTWREAVANCQGKDQARAIKGLADTAQAHASISEISSSGKECDEAWRSAEAMVELAKVAWKEMRWTDSALLYRKATMGWDVAEEKCETGDRHVQAAKKLESAEIDAHNAVNCAPRWGEAKELQQRFKVEGQVLNAQDRSELSMRAEAVWREEAENCKGDPKNQAKSNADAIAKERGTPLTIAVTRKIGTTAKPKAAVQSETLGTASSEVKPLPAMTSASAQDPLLVNAKAAVPIVAPIAGTSAGFIESPTESAKEEAKRIIPEGMAQLVAVAPNVFKLGGMTYEGAFQVDQETRSMSGSGTIKWENGDVFIGTVVKGEKQGKGKFVWHDGQTYDGEWVNNRMDGMADVKYANGDRYTGMVKDGAPEGRGKFVFASGDIFDGEFRQGHFNGFGRYTMKNNDYYEGAWRDDKKNGRGEYVWASGSRSAGIYKDGVLESEVR